MRPVRNVLNTKLFDRDAAFFFVRVQTIESRRHNLIACRILHQVASKLPRDELVVGHVLFESTNHPIAIWPNVSRVIALESVRVRISRDVHPFAGESLRTFVAGEQTIDYRFVSGLCFVAKKRIKLF